MKPLALSLLLASVAFAQPGTTKEIAPGVWFRQAGPNEGCNHLVVEMKDYLAVVDASYPQGANALLADLKKLSPKPVRYVLLTHHHGDHTYGGAVWTRAGATTVAFAPLANEYKRLEPGRFQGAVKNRQDLAALRLEAPEPPKQVVSGGKFVLTDGRRKIEFRHYGWGHTRGDGYVYLPKEKIIATGDAAVNAPANFLSDSDLRNWPRILAKVEKLKLEQVAPGHGPLGKANVIAGQREFLSTLVREVDAARKAGKTLNDLVKIEGERPVSTTVRMPDSVKTWVGPRLPAQLQETWQQLAAAK
ncbi:MAG: MBL fold metallo-hydrolase [Bryobacteraceae bacterium]|nr:MBL fold metallo-hydrolase [Bryobacteraceae bacterium]